MTSRGRAIRHAQQARDLLGDAVGGSATVVTEHNESINSNRTAKTPRAPSRTMSEYRSQLCVLRVLAVLFAVYHLNLELLLAVGFLVDRVEQGVDVFVFGFLVEGRVEQAAGFGVAVAEDAEYLEGFR